MARIVRLTESDLTRLVKRVINEQNKKGNYLNESNGLVKTDYPPCVQGFGEPVKVSSGNYGTIRGKDMWSEYFFYANGRVKKPKNDGMDNYFCSGSEILIGTKKGPTKGNKINNDGRNYYAFSSVNDVKNTSFSTHITEPLKLGSQGDAVKNVQYQLVKQGYGDPIPVGGQEYCGKSISSCDGQYGKGTRDAVIKFQKEKKLTVDGIAGEETIQILFYKDAQPH
jgi:hypothetical protein